jgi:enterochelin esterase family protein
MEKTMRRMMLLMIAIGAASVMQAQVPAATAKDEKPTLPVRNPHTAGYVKATELPDGAVPPANVDGNFILGPTHAPSPLMGDAAALRGTVVQFVMKSEDSKFYPGIERAPGPKGRIDPVTGKYTVDSHAAPYERKVTVYVPKEYVPGTVAPFIVGADGPDKLLFAAIDGVIAAKTAPVMIAVSISNGGGDAQGSERGLEYDTMSGKYAEFIETEVLPRVEAEAKVRLTHDPEGRATMGGSSGGAAALEMAWYHPELYHRVLSYSGTFVNQQWPVSADTPHGAWEFHAHLVPESARKPIRIWMEVGDTDLFNYGVLRDDYHDWVVANEKMANVLAAKGYHYQFVFAEHAGHVDKAVKAQTLPEALEYLWRGYPR